MFVYVDAALDGGVYQLALFSLELGSRSAVLHEPPQNQQCAEARPSLCCLKFIFNVGIREVHLFGDNAAALVQVLRCKAGVGRVYQQRLLKNFRYPWASWPGFTLCYHWFSGAVNPADPMSRLNDQFDGDVALARDAATRRGGNLGVSGLQDGFSADPRHSYGPLCASKGVAMRTSFLRGWGRGGGAEFHEVFLQCRLEESVGAMA